MAVVAHSDLSSPLGGGNSIRLLSAHSPGPETSQVDPPLEVVGHCTQCGAPFYGPRQSVVGAPLRVQRTCRCGQEGVYSNVAVIRKDIRDFMCTK